MSSLKNDAVIAGLARNQDTGSQGFRGVSTVPRKITILPPSEDVSAREDRRSETERKRGAMELMEGGRSGGEFEEYAHNEFSHMIFYYICIINWDKMTYYFS